jgi:hypothetical protein
MVGLIFVTWEQVLKKREWCQEEWKLGTGRS